MATQLILQQKTYDFLLWVYPIIETFPKREKFTLQATIKNKIFEFHNLIIKTNKSTQKKSNCYTLDALIDEIKMLFRLSFDLHYINIKKLEQISIKLKELGSLLGGWIKSII